MQFVARVASCQCAVTRTRLMTGSALWTHCRAAELHNISGEIRSRRAMLCMLKRTTRDRTRTRRVCARARAPPLAAAGRHRRRHRRRDARGPPPGAARRPLRRAAEAETAIPRRAAGGEAAGSRVRRGGRRPGRGPGRGGGGAGLGRPVAGVGERLGVRRPRRGRHAQRHVAARTGRGQLGILVHLHRLQAQIRARTGASSKDRRSDLSLHRARQRRGCMHEPMPLQLPGLPLCR